MTEKSAAFESDDLSEFDSTVTDSGDLASAAAAAMAGTNYGMSCVIDDQNDIYGELNWGSNETRCRGRYYFDPNGLSMGADDDLYLVDGVSDGGDSRFLVNLKYDGSNYTIYIRVLDDGGSYQDSSAVNLSDAEHWIEFDVQMSTGEGNDDGFGKIWIDSIAGAADTEVTGVDNDTRDYEAARFGATAIDSGISGTFYIDEIIMNDDGSAIGAYSAGVVPQAMSSNRRWRS